MYKYLEFSFIISTNIWTVLNNVFRCIHVGKLNVFVKTMREIMKDFDENDRLTFNLRDRYNRKKDREKFRRVIWDELSRDFLWQKIHTAP